MSESEKLPLRLEWVDVKDLKDNPRNWRVHDTAQLSSLRDIIGEVGWAGALLFNERTGRLIDGHARKKVTKRGKVPVLIGSWSEEDEAKILLTLDPLAAMAEGDQAAVAALLKTVQTDSTAVASLFERIAGEAAWQTLTEPAEVAEVPALVDRAAELQAKWGTVPGQAWKIGPHRLLCGDCREKADVGRLWADGGPKIRMVWTDPPYGVSYGEKTAWMEKNGAQRTRRPIANDSLKPEEVRDLFGAALQAAVEHAEVGATIYATVPSVYLKFFIQGMEASGFAYKHQLVWVKQSLVMGRSDYHYRHEPILYGWVENGAHYFTEDRTQDSVFQVDRPHSSDLHPTTKPVELIACMVRNSSRGGEIVYDPFCGSGSTLIAAHQLGRVGYGVEIDPGYVAVALQRLADLGLDPTPAED
jgi:DNA modification methylase